MKGYFSSTAFFFFSHVALTSVFEVLSFGPSPFYAKANFKILWVWPLFAALYQK